MNLQFGFEELLGALPDATVLVSSAGEILDANPAMERLLGFPPATLRGRALTELVVESGDQVHERLTAWSRSRQHTPGALTWRRAEAEPLPCRCDGALVRPWMPGIPALILLQVQPRTPAATQFVLLNQKINELNREIHARQLADEELRRINESLEEEVQHRTKELQVSNDELRYRNRELQEFTSAASHDLQEPLRKVLAFSDLLARHLGSAVDEEAQQYLQRIEAATTRMSSLITALLELARVTTQGRPFEELDLNQVAKEVVSDLEIRITSTHAQVEVQPLPIAFADPMQMRQLFQNLIGNALKFHRPGVPPRVEVSGDVQSEREPGGEQACVLTFRDNGIGFEEKYLDRIFAPFQRLHGRSEYEGSGIGLAICRRIVERHGGSIAAQSAPDAGSLFLVRLPVPRRTGTAIGGDWGHARPRSAGYLPR